MPNVTLSLTGDTAASTLSDSSGNYTFSFVPFGSYTLTPTKPALAPGAAGIDSVDVVAVQRHFLKIALIPPGCQQDAADVNDDGFIAGVDVIAIQRFYLGFATGTANVGKYRFNPTSRSYASLTTNQTAQNYDALIVGDAVSPFSERPANPSPDGGSTDEVASTVASVELPEIVLTKSKHDFIAPATTTAIDVNRKLVGFQGDFTFDERVVSFQSEPVQKAGLTSGNWNVSGRILDGKGPIRTLRISAYSLDFTPLSGKGTLFELRMAGVDKAARGTQMIWAGSPNNFIFIDADLKTQKPIYTAPGSVTQATRR